MHIKIFAFFVLALLAAVVSAESNKTPAKRVMKMRFTKNNSTSHAIDFDGLACESTPTSTGNIYNNGGPIMNGTVNIYLIFYGSWPSKQKKILQNLVTNIGKSAYFNVEKGYGVNGPVVFKQAVTDKYSHGRAISDVKLPRIVGNAITKLGLPLDTNGIYFINGDNKVTENSGFCTEYCGFHTYGQIKGKQLKYAFIGNPSQSIACLNGCSPCNVNASPNGDVGVDAMASVLTHELMEAASDPLGTTWFDSNGYENADKCAYTYGTTTQLADGAYYNMKIGSLNYLIQQLWQVTGGCAKE